MADVRIISVTGTSSGPTNFSTPGNWSAWVAANLTSGGALTTDVVGVVSGIGEINVGATQQVIGGYTANGFTTLLTAQSGHGFMDNLNVRTNPLLYDPTQGAAIRSSGSGAVLVSAASTTIRGLQIRSSSTSGFCIDRSANSVGVVLDSNIIDANNAFAVRIGAGRTVNNLIIVRNATATGFQCASANNNFTNNLIIALTSSAQTGLGVDKQFDTTSILTNNAVIGFGTNYSGTFSASSLNNATDKAGISGGNLSAGAIVSVVAANQFFGPTGADFRLLGNSSSLKGAGTTLNNAPTIDISGFSRATPYDVGPWNIATTSAGGGGVTVYQILGPMLEFRPLSVLGGLVT